MLIGVVREDPFRPAIVHTGAVNPYWLFHKRSESIKGLPPTFGRH